MAWKQIGSQLMTKLTKRVVDAAEVRASEYFIWDGDLPGFGLRILPSGDLRHIPYDANRCLEMISKMFNLAEMWGLRQDGSNPRKHVKKYPEEKRSGSSVLQS